MKEDTITRGIIAGLWGTLFDSVVHISSFFIFHTTTTGHYIAKLAFPNMDVNLLRFSIGETMHYTAGAFVGIFLAYIFKFTGKDHPYLKGIGLGLILWIIHVIVIPNLINSPRPIIFRTELESIVDFIGHIFYGLAATIYLLKAKQGFNKNIN